MQQILKDYYYGDNLPSETSYPKTEQWTRQRKQIDELETQFLAEISAERKKEYEEIMTKYLELMALYEEHSFLEGFRRGVRLSTACIAGGPQI